jgi:hypothetical protein
MIEKKVMENIIGLMVKYIKENGEMVSKKELELCMKVINAL